MLDRNREPISVERWAELFEDPAYRIVREERVTWTSGRSFDVITVWEGIDAYGMGDACDIFHTGVFQVDGDKRSFVVEYDHRTEAQAIAWHELTVKDVRDPRWLYSHTQRRDHPYND